MDVQPNWSALRNYAALAVALHRYDAASLFAPLHSTVRDNPPVKTGPSNNNLIDFDAFVDDDPFGLHSLPSIDTSTPLLDYSGTVDDLLGLGLYADTVVSTPPAVIEVAPVVDDDLFGPIPQVDSGLVLAAFVELGADDVDLLGLEADVADSSPMIVVDDDTTPAGLSAVLENALVAAGSSSALYEQAFSSSVSIDTLLDLLSVHEDTVLDVPGVLAEAVSLPRVASIASG